MKIFQAVRKNMATMGFVPNQQQNNNGKCSEKQLWGILFLLLTTSLIGVYFFHMANSTEEYMSLLFVLIATVGITLALTSLILKNDKIFNTIEMGEKVLIESEFQFLYYIL